jgi:hypothetical protein
MVDKAKAYRQYRKIGVSLTSKIMKTCLQDEAVKTSAKLLNILRGRELLLNSEEEGVAFMDFVLHDYRVEGKNTIAAYQEQQGGETPAEQDLLNAWLAAYTSLFKVTSVLPIEHSLVLTDLLNDQQGIRLLDFSLSSSSPTGLLLFTRLVPFPDFNITSGSTFAFYEDQEAKLLKQYQQRSKKVRSTDPAVQRFVTFFHLNRTNGLTVAYE